MSNSITSNILAIEQMYSNNKFNNYIKYIVFPNFKNLTPSTLINFDFPLTVLVGGNGTNKSSILKALESCCPDHILSKRWFSTHIDAIPEKPVPSFIYGYDFKKNKKVIEAQVLIAKYYRENDPDYWETARPVTSLGMRRLPTDPTEKRFWGINTRWPKIANKKPVYLTFRDSISAFDKFFYYGDAHPYKKDQNSRKEAIRRRSRPLSNVIENSLNSYIFDMKERVIENTELDDSALEAISNILGCKYQKIIMVLHTFFNCEGYTCKIKKNNLDYSEAFAGSGEFAVIKIVYEILKCDQNSLVLLDEPEVSLHPGAQERLINFLLEQTKLKKIQIVIATHSPTMVRHLPSQAIKVLYLNPLTNMVEINKQECTAEEAFHYIGEPLPHKKTIMVEDILASHLIEHSIEDLNEAQKSQLDIKFFNGGAFELLNHFGIPCALEGRTNVYIYLDGDQKTESLPDIDSLSKKELLQLPSILKGFCKGELTIPFDSNQTFEQKLPIYIKILKWLQKFVLFLPTDGNPESIIWEKATDPEKAKIDSSLSYKKKFSTLTKLKIGSCQSNEILTIQRMQLKTIPKADPDLLEIKRTVLTKILT